MIWRVVHSSHGFQFRSTESQCPELVFTRMDDFGLPLIGKAPPVESLDAEDDTSGPGVANTASGEAEVKRYAA